MLLKNDYLTAQALHNVGDVCFSIGDIKAALNAYKSALSLYKELGNYLEKSELLLCLCNALFTEENISDIQEYLNELQYLAIKTKNVLIKNRYLFVKALNLKSNNCAYSKVKAQKIFQKILASDIIDYDLNVFALINMCDILLWELKITGNEKVLQEVRNYTEKLESIAKKHQSYPLMAETYLLQAKLALLELDIEFTHVLLDRAYSIANEKNLTQILRKLSNQYDFLHEKIDILEEFNFTDKSVKERIEDLELEDTIRQLLQKKIHNITYTMTETPILLLILADFGIVLYSKQFAPDINIDKQLWGRLISAMNSIGLHAVKNSDPGSIERIKHKNNTTLIKIKDHIIYCYIYKGHSYEASIKLERTINHIYRSETLVENLYKAKNSGQIDKILEVHLEKIVKEIFI